MPAYIVVQVEVHDQATYDEYRKLVPASLEKYGGRLLVRGGKTETLEGHVVAIALRSAGVRFSRAGEALVGVSGVCRCESAPPTSRQNRDDCS